MADLTARIKPKKSSATGEVPQAADLEVAEIAVNTADAKLFVKHTDNSIKEISGGISYVTAPTSNTSTGTAGQQAYDSSYFYICTATNTWGRLALTNTFSNFTGFQTSFEAADTLFTGGAVGVQSTAQAYDGSQSWLISNSEITAGDGSRLNTGLDMTRRFDCYSLWIYNDSQTLMDGSGSWRQVVAGTADDFITTGWVLYTRANGLALASGGIFQEIAAPSLPNLAANTWHHYYVQIDWLGTTPNKSTVNPEISAWVDGTQILTSQTFSNFSSGFNAPANGLDNLQLATGLSGGGFNRYYDKIIVNVSHTAPVTSGSTTPAAIEAALQF